MLGRLSCRRDGRSRLSAAGETHLRSELEREIGVFLFGKKILPGSVWNAIVALNARLPWLGRGSGGLGRGSDSGTLGGFGKEKQYSWKNPDWTVRVGAMLGLALACCAIVTKTCQRGVTSSGNGKRFRAAADNVSIV